VGPGLTRREAVVAHRTITKSTSAFNAHLGIRLTAKSPSLGDYNSGWAATRPTSPSLVRLVAVRAIRVTTDLMLQ
jgi:hypothetical protein